MIRRRSFLTLLGGLGGLAACPVVARAQQPGKLLIGFLNSGSPNTSATTVAAVRAGLGTLGYVDGQNVLIEFRWADGRFEQLSAMAAGLVGRGAAILVAGGPAAATAAQSLSGSVPIVFV